MMGEPPALGMVTFVDRDKVRRSRSYGYTYKRAGFREVGETKGGLLALQLLPDAMPAAEFPIYPRQTSLIPTVEVPR